MDLNYDIKTWDFSLRATTLTKITQNIVEVARQHPTPTMENEIIAQRAMGRADKLDLLPDMITEIKIMIKPLMKAWLGWYESYGTRIVPILTPAGTVDLEKSARALIGCKNWSINHLFEEACDHCLVNQNEIFRFARQLSSMGNGMYADCMALSADEAVEFQDRWHHLFDDNFERPLMAFANDINCCEGFKVAMCMQNILALEYFLRKVSKDEVHSVLGDWDKFYFSDRWIPPALYVELFKVDQREALKGKYYTLLLRSLLHWPYQHLFLKAAQRLVESLSLLEYFEVLDSIIDMGKCFYEGHKWKGLFIAFWRLGTDYGRELNSSPQKICIILSNVLLMRDQDIAFMVFDDISEINKEQFCYYFVRNYCNYLIIRGEYEVFQVLMHVCKVRDLQLYFLFKKIFLENFTLHDLRENRFECCASSICNRHQMWNKNLQTFLDNMSEWENSGFPS